MWTLGGSFVSWKKESYSFDPANHVCSASLVDFGMFVLMWLKQVACQETMGYYLVYSKPWTVVSSFSGLWFNLYGEQKWQPQGLTARHTSFRFCALNSRPWTVDLGFLSSLHSSAFSPLQYRWRHWRQLIIPCLYNKDPSCVKWTLLTGQTSGPSSQQDWAHFSLDCGSHQSPCPTPLSCL